MPEVDLHERSTGIWWAVQEEFVTVSLAAVEHVCLTGLQKAGASESDARFIADGYVNKALQGDHARGLTGLTSLIGRGLRGEVNFKVRIEVVREKSATALLTAGPKDYTRLVSKQGMELAIKKARHHGVGWVGVPGNGEVLRIYAKQASDVGMIGFVTSAGIPNVAPWGGYEPILHNGPFAFAIPAGKNPPLILDTSTTESSAAGMYLAARQGQEVRPGMVLDSQGEPSVRAVDFPDMEALKQGRQIAKGSLTTLGSSYKSYGLILALGLLCVLTADGEYPWELTKSTKPEGTVLAAIDPAAFVAAEHAKARADAFLDRIRASPSRRGGKPVTYPGETSQRLQRDKRSTGKVALPASHYQALTKLAEELGMKGAL